MPATATKTVKPLPDLEPTVATHPLAPGVVISIEVVTPEIARGWLELNQENRGKKKRRIAAFQRIIAEDMWMFNGASFVFDTSGLMLDGQHRAEGIARSPEGTECLAAVLRGLPKVARATIDTGVPRTVNDELLMAGETYPGPKATMARYVYMLAATKDRLPGGSSVTPGPQEVRAVFEAFRPEISRAAEFAALFRSRYREMGNMSPSVAGYGYFLFCFASDPTTGKEFMERIAGGENLGRMDPEMMFRRRILAASGKTSTDPKLETGQQLALLILAWNALQGKKSLTRLQLPPGSKVTNRTMPDPDYLKYEALTARLGDALLPTNTDPDRGLYTTTALSLA
jgi:hypothetical protein